MGAALSWLIAAIAVAVLLIMYAAMGGDGPVPSPEATYLGLTATVYHLVSLYGGMILVLFGAFGPDRWFGDPHG